jgi:hypothetical protein
MRELPKSETFWNLFRKAELRYWEMLKADPKAKIDMPLLVRSVLDENGMANDPAYDETLKDICSGLGSWNHDQMELFSGQTPLLLLR